MTTAQRVYNEQYSGTSITYKSIMAVKESEQQSLYTDPPQGPSDSMH